MDSHTPHFEGDSKSQAKVEPTYWAMKDKQKTAGELDTRRGQYYEWLGTNGRRTIMRRCWIFYNMAAVLSAAIVQSGDKGQYALLYINEFRRMLQELFQIVINARPAWDPKAMSDDSKALAEVRLARQALDSIVRNFGIDRLFYRAVEYAGVLGEGYVETTWDAQAGSIVKPEDPGYMELLTKSGYSGEGDTPKLHAGDLVYETYSGIDVIRDPNASNYEECDWILTRKFVNKYNLGARYPEHAAAIERMTDISANVPMEQYRNYFRLPYKSDRVILYTFWHKKTPACPDGRELRFMTSDLVLEDKKLAYSRIPISRIAAGEMDGTSSGYSAAFDLCAPMEMVNNINSTLTTLIKCYGVFNIMVPVGSRINEARLPEGLNIFESVGVQKPEPLNFLELKAELLQYMKFILERMENMIGINKANAAASGSAQALQISMSQQFNQFFQSSYEKAFEDTGTMSLEILKNYADAPRLMDLVGEENRTMMKLISKANFSSIAKVVADVSDPMSKTIQGRIQKAQLFNQNGQLSPDELDNVLNTGKLIGSDLGESQEITIAAENEALLLGESFNIIPTDDDAEHLRLHGKALADYQASPDLRKAAAIAGSKEAAVVAAFLDHINMHQAQQGTTQQPGQGPQYMGMKQAMGQKVQQPGAPGQPPQGGPPGPVPGSQPPKGNNQRPEEPAQAPGRPPGAPAGMPDLPNTGKSKSQFQPGTPPPANG